MFHEMSRYVCRFFTSRLHDMFVSRYVCSEHFTICSRLNLIFPSLTSVLESRVSLRDRDRSHQQRCSHRAAMTMHNADSSPARAVLGGTASQNRLLLLLAIPVVLFIGSGLIFHVADTAMLRDEDIRHEVDTSSSYVNALASTPPLPTSAYFCLFLAHHSIIPT
jgi:hypothetical protein